MKDQIISTISEIEEDIKEDVKIELDGMEDNFLEIDDNLPDDIGIDENQFDDELIPISNSSDILKENREPIFDLQSDIGSNKEIEFLEKMKSRLIVVFEGLQSPNNKKIEAKIDLILNFLEYNLAIISDRIDILKQEKL